MPNTKQPDTKQLNKRYHRQIILPEIGTKGQARLSESKVLCVGTGGLGSPALLYLAAAGVGTIGIADFDTVDSSNLQRQILFADADTGKSKAKCAAEKIKLQNPHIKVAVFDVCVNADNIEAIFKEVDLILDGSDNFSTKYLLSDACVKFSKPLVYASISQFEGRVGVFYSNSDSGACYRCLYPAAPKSKIQNCAQAGMLGAVAGIIGTMQALEAIKTLIWMNDRHTRLKPLLSKIAIFDFASFQSSILTVNKNESCSCNHKESILLADMKETDCLTDSISIEELKPNLATLTVIDIREQDEWDHGHIAGALHWPLGKFEENIFPRQLVESPQNCVIYCQAGFRSALALDRIKAHGIQGVRHFKGGYQQWALQSIA